MSEYLVEISGEHDYTVFTLDDAGELVLVEDPSMVSVTTYIERELFEEFDIEATLVRMRTRKNPDPRYAGLSEDEIRTWWELNKKHAARMGTMMHACIESYLKSVIERGSYDDARFPELPPEEPLETPWKTVKCGIAIDVAQFHKFVESICDALFPKLVERRMYDPRLHLCGTLDALFENTSTGELSLYDWKRYDDFTRSDPFGKFGKRGRPAERMSDCKLSRVTVQLNAYRTMADRFVGRRISEQRVVVFHPEAPSYLQETIAIDDGLVDRMIFDRNS